MKHLQQTSDLNNFAKISQVFILLPFQNDYQPFKKKKELTKSNYKHLKSITLHLTILNFTKETDHWDSEKV